MKKIFFFDCDQTIWTSGDHDYISSVVSPLTLVAKNSILRVKDGKIIVLKPEIKETFEKIQKNNNTIGIVSDNRKDMVINALKLFGIYKFIDKNAVSVRLWDGYCPKDKIINEVLRKTMFNKIYKSNIYWLDDKDYSRKAKSIGINFIRVDYKTDLITTINKYLLRRGLRY